MRTITFDPSGTKDSDCYKEQGTPLACAPDLLTEVLQYLHNLTEPVQVKIIMRGVGYTLTQPVFINSGNDITLSGSTGTDGMPTISCHEGAGLGFNSSISTSVTINNLHFDGCGLEYVSTSRNFSVVDQLEFVTSRASLYFENCVDITLDSVTVTNSGGLAVQIYTTVGNNVIRNSNFANNPGKAGVSRGGGIAIEFPYCMPGDLSCKNGGSSVPLSNVSGSHYTIENCRFINNTADTALHPLWVVLPYETYHSTAGQGGGLSVFFKGNAQNNHITVTDCLFQGNKAVYGGGAFIETQDEAYNNTIIIRGETQFIRNNAIQSGGGLKLGFISISPASNNTRNRFILSSVKFCHNSVKENSGGGVSYKTTRQLNMATANNTLSFRGCSWYNNVAKVGAAVDLSTLHLVVDGSVPPVTFYDDCNFEGNSVDYASAVGKPLGSGTLYLDEIPVEFNSTVQFKSNGGTAIVSINARIIFTRSTQAYFNSNTGHNGGAIGIYASGFIEVHEDTSFNFTNNSVTNEGGAIYAEYLGSHVRVSSQNCFIRYYNFSTNRNKWNTSFIFESNQMNRQKNSNAIFATSILPCLWGRAYGQENNSNLIDKVFCWNDYSNKWQYDGDTKTDACKDAILTGPSKFGKGDAPKHISILPGRATDINIVLYDDQNELINGTSVMHAYSTSSESSSVEVDSKYQYITGNTILLHQLENGTVLEKNHTVSVNLDTLGQTVLQTKLVVNFTPCPAGFELEDGICQCSGNFSGYVTCYQNTFNISLQRGYWMGRYKKDDETYDVVGHCKYCMFSDSGIISINVTAAQIQNEFCKQHSEGVLCSQCKKGHGPSLGLNEFACVPCSEADVVKGVFVFISANIMAPFIALLVLYWIDIPLTSGLFHGPIFFAQMISTVVPLDADRVIPYEQLPGFDNKTPNILQKIYITFYNIFNLQFFSNFQDYCLKEQMANATVVAIHYISSFVPLVFVILLMIFYYCCENNSMIGKFFKRFNNVANFLATAILLCYTKIMLITAYLITPTPLVGYNTTESDPVASVLYFDGSIEYLSSEFAPYLVVAMLAMFFVVIPVPLILVCCRHNNPHRNGGFVNHLLEQFQRDFREQANDLVRLEESGESVIPVQDDGVCACTQTCCRPVTKEGSIDIKREQCYGLETKIEYEYKCCADNVLCSYKQQQGHYVPCCCVSSWSFYDYRWVSGGFFVLRVAMMIPYIAARNAFIQYMIQFMICLVAGMLILVVRPYKVTKYRYVDPNIVEALSLFLLGGVITLSMYQYSYAVQSIPLSTWGFVVQLVLVTLPGIWIVVVFGVNLYQRRHKLYCSCCRRRRATVLDCSDHGDSQPLLRLSQSHSNSHSKSASGACEQRPLELVPSGSVIVSSRGRGAINT